MKIQENGTAFDVLAILCTFLTKEEERECAIRWTTATQKNVRDALKRFKNFIAIILNSSANEYRLSEGDIEYLNKELDELQKNKQDRKNDIYRLAIEVEHHLDTYSDWQNRGVIYELEPLNANAEETGIAVYPHNLPQWDTQKSERNRERIWNSQFENYMIVRRDDTYPFNVIMHIWNDDGLLTKTDNGWELSVALSPVMNYAEVDKREEDTAIGRAVCVDGLKNQDVVTQRVLEIFDALFQKQYSIIVFPEMLGSYEIVKEIKNRMQKFPEYCTFVLLPTICGQGRNTLVVLGPGGVECLRQDKTSPFILKDEEGIQRREELEYDNRIHILITRELGNVAFAICADRLDPRVHQVMTSAALVDTIICPSFSPGINAFKETMVKGLALKMLQFYINTCSAKGSSLKKEVPEPLAMVQLPSAKPEAPLEMFSRRCNGQCWDKICYFDILISYENKKFIIEGIHRNCV